MQIHDRLGSCTMASGFLNILDDNVMNSHLPPRHTSVQPKEKSYLCCTKEKKMKKNNDVIQ